MEYHGIERTVEIEGEKLNAFFPVEHSKLAGVILHTKPSADYHGMGVLPEHKLKVFVLYKGRKTWELEQNETVEACEVPTIGDILFAKEDISPEVQAEKNRQDYEFPFN